MHVRLKWPKIGELVRMRNADMYFRLPVGLQDGDEGILKAYESGRYIVSARGRDWNIAFQCVVHQEERFLHGQWLDRWDPRVRREETRRKRMRDGERRAKTNVTVSR